MERKEVKFTPQWEGPIQGWATKFASKNLWKVRPEYDFDDLMQEAYIYYMECVSRYPHVVDPPHFMRLFQTCFRNCVIDLANRRTKRADVAATTCSSPEVDILANAVAKNDGLQELELELVIEDAPDAIKDVLRKVQNGDRKPPMGRKNGLRETTRDYLQRMAGPLHAGVDVYHLLLAWTSGEPHTPFLKVQSK